MDITGHKEYMYSTDTGNAEMKVYQVFPGVNLIYSSVHMNQCDLGDYPDEVIGNLIEIHHCREGRVEQVFDDEVFYLMPGDLAVAIRRQKERNYSFPLNHYHGITIGINTELAPKCFSEYLEDVRVQPMEMARRLCREQNCFYIRKQQYIEHIFSELYTVPEQLKMGYFKVKILELLLILSAVAPEENEAPKRVIPKAQMLLAKQSAEYLTRHMERRITIQELAREFNVSETSLKNAFKAVYGVPVYSYIRIQKMHTAAQKLIHSDLSVADVAYDLGYKSTSKFADAFREIMGETPSEFRENHKNEYGTESLESNQKVSRS